MDILTKFLTVVLFLNCLFLILLVLVQLPKKEAGLGTAFGGGTTDALFGAGAGNVLTKLTKWNAVLFLVLCLFLSLLSCARMISAINSAKEERRPPIPMPPQLNRYPPRFSRLRRQPLPYPSHPPRSLPTRPPTPPPSLRKRLRKIKKTARRIALIPLARG